MKNKRLLLTLFILLLSACTTSVGAELPNPSDDNASPVDLLATIPEVEAQEVETPVSAINDQESVVIDESALSGGDEALVDLAMADLAQRLDVEISDITLVSFKEIVWPDATLGCPKPGMDFSPVEIPGYIFTLEVDGKRYAYHTDDVNRVILCPAEGERPDEIFIMP